MFLSTVGVILRSRVGLSLSETRGLTEKEDLSESSSRSTVVRFRTRRTIVGPNDVPSTRDSSVSTVSLTTVVLGVGGGSVPRDTCGQSQVHIGP